MGRFVGSAGMTFPASGVPPGKGGLSPEPGNLTSAVSLTSTADVTLHSAFGSVRVPVVRR